MQYTKCTNAVYSAEHKATVFCFVSLLMKTRQGRKVWKRYKFIYNGKTRKRTYLNAQLPKQSKIHKVLKMRLYYLLQK